MVYFRPKYKSRRASNPDESRISSTLTVLKVALPDKKCEFCHKGRKDSVQTSKNTNGAVENAHNEAPKIEGKDPGTRGMTNDGC